MAASPTRHAVVVGLCVFASLAVSAPEAAACSCQVRPACQRLFMGPGVVVFEGTVAAIERVDSTNVVRFRDIESLYGVSSTTVRTSAVDSCGIAFALGERYVVDASRGTNGLTTSACSLTSVAARAGELKQFIRGLTRPGPGASVSGTVLRLDAGPGPQRLGGLTVALEGPGTATSTATTTEDGAFRFEGLTPGEYRVAVVPTTADPFLSRFPANVRLPNAHACWQVRLPFEHAGPPEP